MNIIPINLNFQFDEGNETTPIIIIATDEIDVNIGQIIASSIIVRYASSSDALG